MSINNVWGDVTDDLANIKTLIVVSKLLSQRLCDICSFKMAMEEGVIMLIRMYQKFVFTLSDVNHPGGSLKLQMGLTISPKGGLWVKATAR